MYFLKTPVLASRPDALVSPTPVLVSRVQLAPSVQ
jgi:hypothetical protein